MRHLCRWTRLIWLNEPCRWLFTVSFAAAVGIAAGKAVLGISGTVSVVDGSSMEPTYKSGARVLTSSISTPVKRGDIVLLDDGTEEYALKRVVGLPGETVHIWRGRVLINRRLLNEPYLPRFTYTFPDERSNRFVFVLGTDQFFVLGDNRTCSLDSRCYGPVSRSRLKGRVPQPENSVEATVAAYTLPDKGNRALRPL